MHDHSQLPPIEHAPPDRRRWLVLAVMSLGTLMVFLDLTVVNTALPSISLDLGASTAELQWVVDSYVLALAGLLMLGGSLGDRYGRRRWMTVGLVVFGAGSVLAALADDIPVLIAGRAVQGVGAALVLPATLSIVTNTFPREERSRAIAIWTAVGGIGIGFGPAVGGYLVEHWDWAAAFWIHLPIVLLALAGQLVVPESRDDRDVGLDVPGSVTATLGITTLVFAIIQGAEDGWTSPHIVGAFALAAAVLTTFVLIERRAEHPMLPLHFFANRDFTGSVLVIGIMFFAGPATFFFVSQFFQIIQGKSPFEAGLLILPNAGAIVLASLVATKALPRVGPRGLVAVSVTLMATATALMTGIDPSWTAGHEIALIVLFGFGFGLGMPALTDAVMAAIPVEDAGVGSAVNDVARELGSALGVAVIGSFISSLYRANVSDELAGVVADPAVEVAREGLGAAAIGAQSLDPETGQQLLSGASTAFVDAMNSGFWLSTAVLAAGVAVAVALLPRRARATQAERDPAPATTVELDRPAFAEP